MIINNAPANEAIISNVSEIGEFRIRNSAKAFNILSSGLYANKVRAIVRELSCNAVDSHVAAGRADTPFDVHLPNQLEPWFSIRDYGTGLSHDQVTNIYTTYFESTKTNSNDFIGALGLGSKSPFSYTDNFTVTAIKDGVKGVYSAFINEQGVPSIAKMATEETTEPAGVEVKFSVNDRYDFGKFREEARYVYKYFKLRPIVTGNADFTFEELKYADQDIIPGVHAVQDGHRRSVAIMGNIAYPIDVPEADKTLGEVRQLLNCGLVMEFAIGELDFQASREGLSYIPETIASIKRKLDAVNAVLASKVADEANAIENLWERTLFLSKKKEHPLWSAAITKYVADTKFPLIRKDSYFRIEHPTMKTEVLKKHFNILVRAFEKVRGTTSATTLKAQTVFSDKKDSRGYHLNWEVMSFSVTPHTTFVFNDTKIGAFERAKHHYREMHKQGQGNSREIVYVIEPYDRTKPIKRDEFLSAIYKPPVDKQVLASSLLQKDRAVGGGMAKNVTILRLEEKGYGGYYTQRELVWRDAGKADSFDSQKTYYYLPLSGFQLVSAYGYGSSIKALMSNLKDSGLNLVDTSNIYGVRKGDIEFIKTQKNWVNLETYVAKKLATITDKQLNNLAANDIDLELIAKYNTITVNNAGPFTKLMEKFKDFEKVRFNKTDLTALYRHYAPNANFDINAKVEAVRNEINEIGARYPLLSSITSSASKQAVAEYIEMIDLKKGI